MNRKQAHYLLGRAINEHTPLVYAGLGTFAAVQAHHAFGTAPEKPQNYLVGSVQVVVGLIACKEFLRSSLDKIIARHQEKTETRDVAEQISITDEAGLDNILHRTTLNENREFGTLLRTTREKQHITITNILDPQAAEDQGLIVERGRTFVRLNTKVFEESSGYSGTHHYHPTRPIINHSVHYAINGVDRSQPLAWMSLLTFNTPAGPELIGYDTKDTYLPTDTTKRTLVRATPKDIWKYLADKPVF